MRSNAYWFHQYNELHSLHMYLSTSKGCRDKCDIFMPDFMKRRVLVETLVGTLSKDNRDGDGDGKTEKIGSLSKPRRRRQQERHKTKGLMSRTIAVHVRYKSLYISLPSSVKQQREMTKLCVLYRTRTATANFSYFHLELHAAIAHLVRVRF